jgi:hypothetical protein
MSVLSGVKFSKAFPSAAEDGLLVRKNRRKHSLFEPYNEKSVVRVPAEVLDREIDSRANDMERAEHFLEVYGTPYLWLVSAAAAGGVKDSERALKLLKPEDMLVSNTLESSNVWEFDPDTGFYNNSLTRNGSTHERLAYFDTGGGEPIAFDDTWKFLKMGWAGAFGPNALASAAAGCKNPNQKSALGARRQSCP